MNIAGVAVKYPVLIVMMVIAIITLGIMGYNSMAVDILPNIESPTVSVYTIYAGASAEDMESLITKPIEDNLSTLEGMENVTSISKEGISVVSANFKIGYDVKLAENRVRDRVNLAKPSLPKDIEEPKIRRFSMSDIPVLNLSLTGDRDLAELKDIMVNDIKPRFEKIEGVANVEVFGGRDKIIKISVDKSLLIAQGISFQQIVEALNKQNMNFPVGEIRGTRKNLTLRVTGKFENMDDIRNLTLLTYSGRVIRIKDIAKVEFTTEDETTRVRVNDKNAVLFGVFKQSGANTIDVADKVKAAMEGLSKELAPDLKLGIAVDTSAYIKRSTKSVQEDIILGGVLSVLIVWLFLGNFRSTIITAVALPNSLLGAFFIISGMGFTINIMTLMALSLSVGLLIDDSIVVRENIFRHIEEGATPHEAAVKGTNQVALAVVSTTLSIMAVFMPISFLHGIIGQFFKQFGFTIAFALLISLLDAFTTAPMLSAYWYKATKPNPNNFFQKISNQFNLYYDSFNQLYKSALQWTLDHKKIVIFSTIGLFVLSLFLVKFIGMSLMGREDRGLFTINIVTYPGAPLDVTDQEVRKVESFILRQKEVEQYYTSIGRDGQNTASVFVTMKPVAERAITSEQMITRVRDYMKKTIDSTTTYELSQEGLPGTGEDARFPFVANVTGPNYIVLQQVAEQMKRIIQETPGASDATSSYKTGKPEIKIRLDTTKAVKLGVSTYDVGTMLRTLVQGVKISSLKKDEKDYDINLTLVDENKRNFDDIKNLLITTRDGRKIPLASVCNFVYTSGPTEIRRENKQRIIKISASTIAGYPLSEVTAKIKEQVAQKIQLPSGYSITYGGQAKQSSDMAKQIITAIFISVLFMYMILASLYNSFVQPFILMLSVPLAIIGSFGALLLTGIDLDVFGFIGLLLVLGLVAKNSILLIDFTNKMRRENKMSIREALLYSGPLRLRPIIMTTFAMIFGMLPLALGLGEGARGRESLPVVVIGGLITSTLLTLVFIPAVYEIIEGYFERRKAKLPHP